MPTAGRLLRSFTQHAAVLCAASLAVAGGDTLEVTAVRHWSLADLTRIAVEVSGDFRHHSGRLANPDRIYFDIFDSRSRLTVAGARIPVGDNLLKQVRVAQTTPTVTRVVLDLEAPAEVTASQLALPGRLVIELRAVSSPAGPPASLPVPYPPRPAEPALTRPAAPFTPASPEVKRATPAEETPAVVGRVPNPAKRNRSGDRSLTRVLGLKLGKVVLDPGHGGHDVGSTGPGRLVEKELVLDIARRLAALLEQRMASEVVLTRGDDEFVTLERRTEIANQQKADLFLSIHANSSPYRSARGVETFYLNFTTSRADLETAARENAGSERSIHELSDLIRKIALKDKMEESREFAARVQNSLHELAVRNGASSKNRGVKKAPFVVLIGAAMPSVLAEIGFLSNPKDETLMKMSEHRQRVAEALYKGIEQYAATLSHFKIVKVAGRQDATTP